MRVEITEDADITSQAMINEKNSFRVSPTSAKFLAFVFTGIVFCVDWWSDTAINVGIFYACVLVILAWTQSFRWLWCWTFLTITLVGLDLIENGFNFTRIEAANRFITVCMLLVTAAFVHFSMLISRQLDANEKLLIEVAERKRAEESLRKAQDDLARVSRATSMGELAASIAHEVNQPLSGIVINGNACMRWLSHVEGKSPHLDEARQAIARIIRDGKRAGDVILRLRNFFKKADGEKIKLCLSGIVEEVVVLVRHDLERKKVTLRTELDRQIPHVLADPVQIQQVVLNLILNGADSMAAVEGRPRDLIIRTGTEGKSGYLEVKDSGSGIEKEDLERIFQPFYTTKQGGMGMGLSISRSILEKHNGKLSAKANRGPGMSFRFTIPLYSQEEQPCRTP
jgi:signal transduction histidine kinase